MAEVLNPNTPPGQEINRTSPINGEGGHLEKRGLRPWCCADDSVPEE